MQKELKFSDMKQTQEIRAKRTAKNSVFLDLFQNKSYLLKLYQTLHPEECFKRVLRNQGKGGKALQARLEQL